MSGKRDKKKSSFLDSKINRTVVVILEIAGLLSIVIVTCAVLRGDIFNTFAEETTKYVLQNRETESQIDELNNDSADYSYKQNGGSVTGNTPPKGNSDVNINDIWGNNNQYTQNTGGGNSSVQNKLPSTKGWSKADIVAKARDAVNKTQGYRNNVSVHHKESFSATVTECTGGSIVKTIANTMVGWIVKPVDETLNYSNGRATNSDGENVPLILPKKGSFNLSSGGVSSASATVLGDEYVIKLNIVSESVGIDSVPTHNAASIGYLDVANFDISFMDIDSADITYKGSSIELHINSEGYVTYAVYKVPLHITGSAHRGSISGSATFTGEQTEVWTINY